MPTLAWFSQCWLILIFFYQGSKNITEYQLETFLSFLGQDQIAQFPNAFFAYSLGLNLHLLVGPFLDGPQLA